MLKKVIKSFIVAILPRRLFVIRESMQEPVLYLTFDDGPTPEVTDKLLDLLQRYDVKASFFVIGKKLEENMHLGEQIIEQGHSLGNHSYDHIGFGRLALSDQIHQADRADELIQKHTQAGKKLFRAPQGHWNISLVFSLFRKGYRCIHWSCDSMDYSNQEAAEIIASFKRKPVRNGEIILFHDDAEKCIQVLTEMLPVWESNGFKFKALN